MSEDWEERVQQEAMAILSRREAKRLGILPTTGAEKTGEQPPTPTAVSHPSPAHPLPKGLGLLRTPSLDDIAGVTLDDIRSRTGHKVPDEDRPGSWKDAEAEPEPEPETAAPEPVLKTRAEVGLSEDEEPVSEADRVEELLRRSGMVAGKDAKTTEPPYTYWVLDGSELVEEAYVRPKRLMRVEKDPLMRDLMAGQVVFIAGETPYSLSELYRKARRRQFKAAMRLVKVEGMVGTVVRNAGWLHAWSTKRPLAEVFEEVDGRPVRLPERPVRPDGRRTSDRLLSG